MAKRLLTKHQQWRIKKIQQDRIDRINKKSTLHEKQFDNYYQIDTSSHYPGLVINNFGQSLDIEYKQDIYRCSFRQNLGAIVTGDEIIWHKFKSDKQLQSSARDLQYDGVVIALKERRSLLVRPDGYGNKKTIAANIDQIIIINTPASIVINSSTNNPATAGLNTGLIDRYLLSAEKNHIQAVIVINKIDLLSEKELTEIKSKLQAYKKLEYEVVYTSILTQSDLPELTLVLADKNSILVGQSGVGKSSLLNLLIPGAQAKTATISGANTRGLHTTTSSQLYHLEKAGIKNATLIDSPGIREFGLWNITREDIHNGFKEIKKISKTCRFRNCLHEKEPDCAILKALDEQLISPERYNSYKKLLNHYSK